MTYTIEDVINVINEELDEAYTEASKEEADIYDKLGAERRERAKKYNDKGKVIDSKLAEPKGDAETVRKKNIRKFYSSSSYGNRSYKDGKEYNGLHYSDGKKIPTKYAKYASKSGTAGKRLQEPGTMVWSSKDNPYAKTRKKIREDEEALQNKLKKKAKDFRDKEGKSYEVYYGEPDKKNKDAQDFIKKTRAAGKHPITRDTYMQKAFYYDYPEYQKSVKRENDSFRKLDMSERLTKRAKEGFKNKDVEEKWKKFVDKYQETVESIYKAYEDDIISYESAYELLDLIDLDNYEFED